VFQGARNIGLFITVELSGRSKAEVKLERFVMCICHY